MIGLIWILIFLVIFLITQIRESQEIKSDNKQTEKHKKHIINMYDNVIAHFQRSWIGSTIGALTWVVVYQVYIILYSNRKSVKVELPEIPNIEQIEKPKKPLKIKEVQPKEDPKPELKEWEKIRGKFDVKTIKPETYLTKNFQFWEFKSKDGVMPTQEELDNIAGLAVIMQIVRDYFNSGKVQLELHIVNAVHLNSAHRSRERNEQTEGSAVGSYHIPGMAVDFRVDGYTPSQVFIVMEHLIKTNQIPKGGLSKYATHVHYDYRGFNARW